LRVAPDSMECTFDLNAAVNGTNIPYTTVENPFF
jgi:hypothetical protein